MIHFFSIHYFFPLKNIFLIEVTILREINHSLIYYPRGWRHSSRLIIRWIITRTDRQKEVCQTTWKITLWGVWYNRRRYATRRKLYTNQEDSNIGKEGLVPFVCDVLEAYLIQDDDVYFQFSFSTPRNEEKSRIRLLCALSMSMFENNFRVPTFHRDLLGKRLSLQQITGYKVDLGSCLLQQTSQLRYSSPSRNFVTWWAAASEKPSHKVIYYPRSSTNIPALSLARLLPSRNGDHSFRTVKQSNLSPLWSLFVPTSRPCVTYWVRDVIGGKSMGLSK